MTFDAGAEAMMARSACRNAVLGLSHDELTMVLQRAYEAGRLAALAEAEKVARDFDAVKFRYQYVALGPRAAAAVGSDIADAIARLRKGAG